jgi:hypothetical protein
VSTGCHRLRIECSTWLRPIAAALVFMSGITVQAAAEQPTPQDILRILRSGALNDRYQAARDVLQIPPEQRDEALWVAVAGELQRVASDSHARTDALIAGRQVPSLGEEHSEYFAALTEAVGQWRDPRAIRPLISAGNGMLATRGIIRFGDVAVPLLIEAARTGHRSERVGVPNVIGGGILFTPPQVAAAVPHPLWFLAASLAGGGLAFAGAMAYATTQY